jgi:iron-sulfur cluster repair protein YtfE (RIC family)
MSTSAAHAPAPLPGTATPDGFELLDVCHRQTLFTLGKLAALVSRLASLGADTEARAMAAEVVHHFSTTSRSHHEDEERHVFPKLLAGADAEVVAAVLRLQQDHGWLEEDWRELAPQLKAIAEGQVGVDFDTLREMVTVFTALSHDHMALEESLIYPQARSRLTALERRDIGRQIAARRRAR